MVHLDAGEVRWRGQPIRCDWGPTGDLCAAAVQVQAWDRVGLLRDSNTLVAAERAMVVEHDHRTTTVHPTLAIEGGGRFPA